LETQTDEATLVVSRRIKPGHEKEYEDWLVRVTSAAKGFPGFKGATTLLSRDGDPNVRYVIWRFESKATLESWKNSPLRLRLIEEVEDYASQQFAEATGMETWFALPDVGAVVAPPKWKMALVTVLGAYVINFFAHLAFSSYVDPWPWFANTFVYIVVLVLVLTYLMMPYLSRLLRNWLYGASYGLGSPL
jgi:uncharacterized protein